MRIGIDCRVLSHEPERAGVANYTYHLVKNLLILNASRQTAMRHQLVLFWGDVALPELSGMALENLLNQGRLPIWHSQIKMRRQIDSQKLDVIFFPTNQVPLILKTPYLTTVHDLAIFRNPKWFPYRPLARLKTKLIWYRARRLIAVSEFTRRELIDFGFPPEKIKVVLEGVEPMFMEPEAGQSKPQGGPYLIHIGTLEPRKNLEFLLREFVKARQSWPELKLFLIGRRGWHGRKLFDLVNQTDGVDWLGYLPESQKQVWLRGAKALVYVSHYEGFGLPILEAFSAGVSVIASGIPPHQEIAQDAAILVEPGQSLVPAILSLKDDGPTSEKIKKAHLRADQFTWEKTAASTLTVLENFKNS